MDGDKGGHRLLQKISEVAGYENGRILLNPIYKFEEDENTTLKKVSGSLRRTGNRIRNQDKFVLAGIYDYLEEQYLPIFLKPDGTEEEGAFWSSKA